MTQEDFTFYVHQSESLILLITGLSGAGKDTIINRIKDQTERQFHFVVTCNTRKIRPGEVDGKDYHFVTREKFVEMINNSEMIEYSKVYDDYKGVPRYEVEFGLNNSLDLILRLDIQGTEKVKRLYPDAVSIFIIPPDSKTWLDRLNKRGVDSAESLALRIKTAEEEISHMHEFDYIVVNDDLDQAVQEILSILKAEQYSTRNRKVTVIKRKTTHE